MDLIQHAIAFHQDSRYGLTTQALERALGAASQNKQGITSCLDVFGVPYSLRYKLLFLMHDNGEAYRIPVAA